MKDRNGNEISIGDSVFVLPVLKDTRHQTKREGGKGFVRKIMPPRDKPFKQVEQARVDNGPREMTGLAPDGPWTWSEWLDATEIEKL